MATIADIEQAIVETEIAIICERARLNALLMPDLPPVELRAK
jgi:hypothetical protein